MKYQSLINHLKKTELFSETKINTVNILNEFTESVYQEADEIIIIYSSDGQPVYPESLTLENIHSAQIFRKSHDLFQKNQISPLIHFDFWKLESNNLKKLVNTKKTIKYTGQIRIKRSRNWIIIFGKPSSILYKDINELLFGSLFFAGITIIIFSFLIFILLKKDNNKLKESNLVLEELLDGNNNIRLKIGNNSQLDPLFLQINQIIDYYNDELQNLKRNFSYVQKGTEFLKEKKEELVKEIFINLDDLKKIKDNTSSETENMNTGINLIINFVNSFQNILNEIQLHLDLFSKVNISIEDLSSSINNSRHEIIQSKRFSDEIMQQRQTEYNDFQAAVSIIKDVPKFAQKINKLAIYLKDIAAKTDLLAMNASVEAVHAGAHSGSFSIVAEEIKNLALNSIKNTEEIFEISEIMCKKANEGIEEINNIEKLVKRMNEQIEKIHNIINKIDISTEKSFNNMRNINKKFNIIKTKTEKISTDLIEENGKTKEISKEILMIKRFNYQISQSIQKQIVNEEQTIKSLQEIKLQPADESK